MNRSSHIAMFRLLVWREVVLAWRRKADVLSTLAFFVIVVSLFPLSVDPEPHLLQTIGPAIVWVCALLASMLALGRLFINDHADGTLEQMLISPQPLILTVAGKVLAHWLVTGIPLVLISPVLGLQFGLTTDGIWSLVPSLMAGAAVFSLVGCIGAALTLGIRGGGVLVALIVLPLCIPVLVFGAGGSLALVGAVLALTAVFAPWASASALRISVE
jgi:heme exporter protein B